MIVAVCPKCGADLEALTYTTYPPIHAYRCRKCGWTQEERENITRVPIATVERKPITNYDRLVSKSPEELARFVTREDLCELTCNSSIPCDGRCEAKMLDWLKREVEE